MALIGRPIIFLGVCLLAANVLAETSDQQRNRANYMLHCQGCHVPQAVGALQAVPRINQFAGYFLHSDEGRRFLIQVPGVATADLTDQELADLMNWLLQEESASQLPADWIPYSDSEVARLRQVQESDPLARRVEILDRLATTVPELARRLQAGDYAY